MITCIHRSVLLFIQTQYRTAYSNRIFIMSPATSLLTYLQKWRQVLLNSVDGRSVVVSTQQISRIIVKQTNSNWGTFNMCNIMETFRNYFRCELLLLTFSFQACPRLFTEEMRSPSRTLITECSAFAAIYTCLVSTVFTPTGWAKNNSNKTPTIANIITFQPCTLAYQPSRV